MRSCAARASANGKTESTIGFALPLFTSSKAPSKSSFVPIVEPRIVSCFHQTRWSAAFGFGPVVAPQTVIRPCGLTAWSEVCQVASPTCSTTTSMPPPSVIRLTSAADVLDDDVCTVARRLLDRLDDVTGLVVHDCVGAELLRLFELLVARRRRDHTPPERLRQLQRSGADPAADAPDEHPLSLAQPRPCDKHPVDGLEDERERRGLLEGQIVRNLVHLRLRHRDQLGVRAIHVLADDADPVAVLDPGVNDHPPTRLVEAGAVCAEDPRLRNGREPCSNPEVEAIERGCAKLDHHLAIRGHRVRRLLVAKDFGPAVLVDPDRLH